MNIEEYLNENNINREDFAKSIGITRKTLYRIIKGHGLKLSTAKEIVRATKGKVTLKDLLEIDHGGTDT